MHLHVLGLSHLTAPIDLRERVAFPEEAVAPALRDLLTDGAAQEAAIVSTCNRTEIYTHASEPTRLQEWLARTSRVPEGELAPRLYLHSGPQAVRHTFRVASGLDSMVLGEPQILGQVKQAVRLSEGSEALGPVLSQLFQRSFTVAKEVRSSTAIGDSSVSMAAAAVRLAQRIFDDLGELSVLFIGAGEMIELAATHFAAQKPRRMAVANRTLERGEALAQRLSAEAITLAQLHDHIAHFDLVITSTASSLPILGKGLMERAIRVRRRKPVFMLDLAVPRDIEPEVAELGDVFLYTVDDLARVVSEGREKRSGAVTEAEAIIDRAVDEFIVWWETRASVPAIRLLRDYAEQFRGRELLNAHAALARGEDPARVLDTFSRALLNKFLHHPTVALKRAPGEERAEMTRLINQLYNLSDEP